MLERLLNRGPVVSTLASLRYKDQLDDLEWTQLSYAANVLSVFNDVTNNVSAEANVPLPKTTVLFRIMMRKVR